MNALHGTLIGVLAVFALLWVAGPRRHRTALTFLRYAALFGIAGVMAAPFFWLLSAAFKDPEVFNRYVFFPPLSEWSDKTVNLKNFRELFRPQETIYGAISFWQYALNSLFLTCAGTVLAAFLASMGGYALAKYEFRFKNPLMFFMLGTMMIPGVMLMAPNYQLITDLGLMDSYWAILLPGAVGAFGVLLFRQVMLSIPTDIIDAGRIDGCGEFTIYWRLIMPLVRPITAAYSLLFFLGSWNSYIGPNIFLKTQYKLTLPVILNLYIGQYSQQYGVFLAGTLLAILPPAILFFTLQKEFISGLTSGAVKQ